MIRTTPLRRINLHFSQIRRTLARTFMVHLCKKPTLAGKRSTYRGREKRQDRATEKCHWVSRDPYRGALPFGSRLIRRMLNEFIAIAIKPVRPAIPFANFRMPAKTLPLAEPRAASPKGTYSFISLGCPKNTVDSERMLGKLAQEGYALQADAAGADVVVVNTCGFIEPARQESLAVIREMLALKQAGKVGAVVVAGCMAERQREVLLEAVPEVDQIVGVFGREEIAAVVDRAVTHRDEQRSLFRPAPVRAVKDTARLRITPRHYAY